MNLNANEVEIVKIELERLNITEPHEIESVLGWITSEVSAFTLGVTIANIKSSSKDYTADAERIYHKLENQDCKEYNHGSNQR